MRAVLQRVSQCSVEVSGEVVGSIGPGLLVLLGVSEGDDEVCCKRLARRLVNMRIHGDENGKFNLALKDIGGEMMVVSQFTLYADCRKGNRPSFIRSARPEVAEPLYERFCEEVEALGIDVARGVFGAMMNVSLVNNGPVTIQIDEPELDHR